MGGRFKLTILLLILALIAVEPAGAQEAAAPTPEQQRLEKQKRVLEAMQAERQNRQKDKQKAEQQRQDTAVKCKEAQQVLQSRQNARYLYRQDKDGERVIFSEEERAQSTAEAEAAVKEWCK